MAAKKSAGLAGLRETMEKRYGTSRVSRRAAVKGYDVIPTGSYSLDYALRTGGWVRGRIHEIVGKEGCSKTTLVINSMANAQRLFPKLAVGYVDMEQAFDWDWAEKNGLDTDDDKFLHVYPDDSEDVSDQIRLMAETGQFSMIVIDSIGGMESKQAFQKDAGDSVVGRNAQVITRMVKHVAVLARQHNVAILIVNQYRCLAEGTLIQTDQGIKEIQDVVVGDKVLGKNAEWVGVEEVQESGVVSGRLIQAQDSAPLGISDNHRQMVLAGNGEVIEKLGREMAPGDWLVEPLVPTDRIAGAETNSSHDEKMAFVCGLHFADGSIHFSKTGNPEWWVFGERSAERLAIIKEALSQVYPPEALGQGEGRVSVVGGDLRRAFVGLGIGTNGPDKKVPGFVLRGDRNIRRQFLRGASMDTHGFSRNQFIWTGEGLGHIRIISMMLRDFGIRGSVRLDRTSKGDFWRLFVSSSDAVRFTQEIGFCEPTKQALAESLFTETSDGGRGKRDLVPAVLARLIYETIVATKIEGKGKLPYYSALRQVCHRRLNASRTGLVDLCRELADLRQDFARYLDLLEHNRFFEVLEVEATEFPAYDIQVEGGLFIAEGVLTHNSQIGSMSMRDESAGPKAAKYATTTKVELARTGETITHKFSDNPSPEVVAKEFRARVTRNKVAAEGKVATYWLITQETPDGGPIGIDQASEALAVGLLNDVIEQQPGGYYSFPWTKTPKDRIRGRDSVLEFLRDNPDRAKEITRLSTEEKSADLRQEPEIELETPEGNIIVDGQEVNPKTGEMVSS